MKEIISKKSRLLAFLLAFFFGALGIHRFYLGKTGSGIFMFILTLSGVFLFISLIWALIDSLVILCGASYDKTGKKVFNWQESL